VLVAIGVSHKTAPIEIREKLAFFPEVKNQALADLVAQTALEEAVLLSTCNRTEIYGRVKAQGAETQTYQPGEILEWWQCFHPVTQSLDAKAYYHLSGDLVVKHLMRLACGLDSLALGETQILGQLKQAYQHSKQQGAMGRILSQTFEAIFSVAKKIRTQTEISKHPTSISYLSLLMAKRIFSDLSSARVLLLGAGENIRDMIPHLKTHKIENITITNRTYENAHRLAKEFNMKARQLSELKGCIAQADIIVTSTYSDERLIDFDLVHDALEGQKHRPILMLDLGVPRDIHENVKRHNDVYLYTIDDLTAIADENKTSRKKAAEEAEKLIAYESCAFTAKLHATNHNHIILNMREKAELKKKSAITQAKKQLGNGRSPEEVIENLAYTLTNQLLHEPTVKMRQALVSQDEAMIEIFKQIFGEK